MGIKGIKEDRGFIVSAETQIQGLGHGDYPCGTNRPWLGYNQGFFGSLDITRTQYLYPICSESPAGIVERPVFLILRVKV